MADLYNQEYSELNDTFNDWDSRLGNTRPNEISRGIGDSPPPWENYMPPPKMNQHGGAILQN